MELLKKINFKQPKYMIPALIYFPLLFTGYFAIDMFHTEKAEINFSADLADLADLVDSGGNENSVETMDIPTESLLLLDAELDFVEFAHVRQRKRAFSALT